MAKKKQETLPQIVYVYIEDDSSGSYLVADREMLEVGDKNSTRLVGTYKLIETGELKMLTEYKKLTS